ncbi:hypothetical protein RA086_01500 [Lactiplantibacillus sp. WILCCON 0030]|uniref:Cell surface protein n=1 Tax=Lactiplantibacillus brownii TaxID=3069269 RepID=A0ABU1A5T1_9LACO|nr:hypothetical protein [Lactiplantibacillus brownii]MDQ7936327.1 hypothetical protein [Lactiplantibacillus brownii]
MTDKPLTAVAQTGTSHFDNLSLSDPYFEKTAAQPMQSQYQNELRRFPELTSVSANYTSNDHRVTSDTTTIDVKFSGNASIDEDIARKNNILKFELVVMSGKQSSLDLADSIKYYGNTPYGGGETTTSIGFSANYDHYINVGLKNIKSKLPLKVGFRLTTRQHPNVWTTYSFGTIKTQPLNTKPTIDQLTPASQTIEGHGTPGNYVTSNIDPDNEQQISPSGKYQLALKNPLGVYLSDREAVTVTESNAAGDAASASQYKLNLSHAAQNPEFDLEDSADLTPETLPEAIAKQLDFKVENTTDVKFESSYSVEMLSTLIEALKLGKTIEVPIYATKPGYIQSNTIVVKVTKSHGTVIFNQSMGGLDFGEVTVPMRPTRFFPVTNFEITVKDHRSKPVPWQLSAQTVASDTKDSYDLRPYLHFLDKNLQEQSLDSSVVVYRKAATDTQTLTSIPFGNNAAAVGPKICITAGPDMKVGKYAATIQWTLADVPVNGN